MSDQFTMPDGMHWCENIKEITYGTVKECGCGPEPKGEWVCMDCENGVSPCAYCGYCKRHCECTYEVMG